MWDSSEICLKSGKNVANGKFDFSFKMIMYYSVNNLGLVSLMVRKCPKCRLMKESHRCLGTYLVMFLILWRMEIRHFERTALKRWHLSINHFHMHVYVLISLFGILYLLFWINQLQLFGGRKCWGVLTVGLFICGNYSRNPCLWSYLVWY